MTADPRAVLDRFVAALEAHLEAVTARRSEQDAAVDDAYDVLADAFDAYAEVLGTTFNEALPFDLSDDDDEDDDDLDLADVYDVDKVPDEAFDDFDEDDDDRDGLDEDFDDDEPDEG